MNRIFALFVLVSFSLVGCGTSLRREVAVPFDFDAAIAKATPQVSVAEPLVVTEEVKVVHRPAPSEPTAPNVGKLQAQINALLAQLESMGEETDRVEVSTTQQMQEQINSLLRQISQTHNEDWETYLVESGDTLGALLVARGISPSNKTLEEVVRKNALESAHLILAGQKLLLPKGKAATVPTPSRTVVPPHLPKDVSEPKAEAGVQNDVTAPPTVVETLQDRFGGDPARAQIGLPTPNGTTSMDVPSVDEPAADRSAETDKTPALPAPESSDTLPENNEVDQAHRAAMLGLTKQIEELESENNELKMERDGARHTLRDEQTKFFWMVGLLSLGIALAAFAVWWFLTRRFNRERQEFLSELEHLRDVEMEHQAKIIEINRKIDKMSVELATECRQKEELERELLKRAEFAAELKNKWKQELARGPEAKKEAERLAAAVGRTTDWERQRPQGTVDSNGQVLPIRDILESTERAIPIVGASDENDEFPPRDKKRKTG